MTEADNARDWGLMARLAADDESALDEILSRWEQPVLTFIHRQLGRRGAPDAEDLALEVFWRVYEARRSARPTGSFPAWLFRIAYNLCVDYSRKRNRLAREISFEDLANGSPGAALEPPAPASHQPDTRALNRELAEHLEEALGRLPENQRAALVLCKIEGLSYQEIAAALGCSISSVEALLFRARRNIQAQMAPYLRGH